MSDIRYVHVSGELFVHADDVTAWIRDTLVTGTPEQVEIARQAVVNTADALAAKNRQAAEQADEAARVPPVKAGVWGSVIARPDSGGYPLYNGDPACDHRWLVLKSSGYECNNCPGWHCA